MNDNLIYDLYSYAFKHDLPLIVDAADEIKQLRKELADVYSKSAQVIADLSANLCTASALERERITAERDEARRIACENEAAFNRMVYNNSECSDPIEVMRERGWDCFKEDGKPCQ